MYALVEIVLLILAIRLIWKLPGFLFDLAMTALVLIICGLVWLFGGPIDKPSPQSGM